MDLLTKYCNYYYQIVDNAEDITTDDQPRNTQSNLDTEEVTPELKRGINLPKKESEWAKANEYFKFAIPLNGPIVSEDLIIGLRRPLRRLNLCLSYLEWCMSVK